MRSAKFLLRQIKSVFWSIQFKDDCHWILLRISLGYFPAKGSVAGGRESDPLSSHKSNQPLRHRSALQLHTEERNIQTLILGRETAQCFTL